MRSTPYFSTAPTSCRLVSWATLQTSVQRRSYLREGLDRGELDLGERFAAELCMCCFLEAVELQVDLEAVARISELLEQARVLREADAVGIDHHRGDRLLVGVAEHRDEVGVQRRFRRRKAE